MSTTPLAALTINPALIMGPRQMGGFIPDAVVEERHEHTLTVTRHPVEFGAMISDHAYKEPVEVVLIYAWSIGGRQNSASDPNFLVSIFGRLLQLQVDHTLFQVVTGKRVYQNMILKTLTYENDFKTENLLLIRAVCQEVLSVQTTVVNIADAVNQLSPNRTTSITNTGTITPTPAPNFNSGAFNGALSLGKGRPPL